MEAKTLLELVAEILEIEIGEIALESDLEEKGWDSLANLSFIAEIDERAGVSLDANELADARTVQDLLTLVSEAAA